MPSLKRNKVHKRKEPKPEVVTANFELHYEDVVQKHRFTIIVVFASALVLLTAFIPRAVYQTIAEPDQVSVEVESGSVDNPQNVTIINDDITASGDAYIEFNLNLQQ